MERLTPNKACSSSIYELGSAGTDRGAIWLVSITVRLLRKQHLEDV